MAALRAGFQKTVRFIGPIKRFYVTDDAAWKNAPSINQVFLLGRVGSGPQSRGTEQNPVTVFTMATNTTFKDMNGDFKQRTEWHRVSVFKPHLRENVYNYLNKGQRCFVQGKIGYGQVTDATGTTRNTTTVFAGLNKVTLMGRAGNKPVRQGTDKKATVFNLATNSIEMDENGEMKKRTDWHRIAVFKPHLQESVYNYLQKGQRCLVQGQLTYGEVKDFAGVSHPSTTIFAEQVVLLLPRKKKEDD
uniref:Single-stranded DNA-binding protein n=1 Tax=Strigamia maritima TaxID=126957 RepID=T1JEX3_STRMM